MRTKIETADFLIRPEEHWGKRWMLLCAGDFESGDYNAMTVAWGSFGVMWHKPFAQIVVRPGRYTYEFLEKHPDFTLSLLPEKLRNELSLMGSKSGRDMDKVAATGLHPIASEQIGAPGFDEAELILECRTMYRQPMLPECFQDDALDSHYPKKDYHMIYFGEILNINGTAEYSK